MSEGPKNCENAGFALRKSPKERKSCKYAGFEDPNGLDLPVRRGKDA
jgi:hypothetical protein